MATKTLRIRLKDKHAATLRRWAFACNQVWNYCNDLSSRSIRERRKFLSGYDLQKYTSGSSKLLGLNAATVQMIGHEYVTRRKQFNLSKLSWRKSGGVRRSLGWIPFRHDCIQYRNGQIVHNGVRFGLWDSYGLSAFTLGSGNFCEDSRGRWYLNVVVEFTPEHSTGTGANALDLGCKEAATTASGEKLVGRWYRGMEEKLATAQRAGKTQRVQAIHAKVANRRKDALHKLSRKLVNENAAIFVGNVSSQAMVKTDKAKGALDAGWGTLRTILKYKCAHAGIVYEDVNEAYTTVTCSCCKKRTGPSGLEGLRIREWRCVECGAFHACRDRNSALNILALGHERLAVGIPHQNA